MESNSLNSWQQRQAWFFRGAPAALIPALAFLPAFAYLVMTPAMAHGRLVATVAFPIMAGAEFWGVIRLVRCCAQRELDLISILAFGALMCLLIIVVYTAFFLALVTGRLF